MGIVTAAAWELTANEPHIHGTGAILTTATQVDAVVQSAVALNGHSASLCCDTTPTNARSLVDFNLSGSYTELFWSLRFSFDAVPTGSLNYPIWAIGWTSDPTATNIEVFHHFMEIVKNGANADLKSVIGAGSGMSRNEVTVASFSAINTEMVFELRIKIVSAQWLWVELKKDGTLIHSGWARSVNDTSSAFSTINKWQIGANLGGTAIGVKAYYAELLINDTSGSVNNKWPGNTQTWTTLTPNGAGSNLAYTAWTGDQTNIDESPTAADALAERLQEATLDDKEGWTMTSATVTTPRALVHVIDWFRFKVSAAGDVKIKFLTWDGAEVASSEYVWEVTNTTNNTMDGEAAVAAYGAKGQAIVQETQPSGGAWDQTAMDALECGVHLSTAVAGVAVRVEAMRSYWIDGAEGPTPIDVGTGPRRAGQIV